MSSYINALSKTANIPTTDRNSGESGSKTLGQEDFLTLLVAQMENQDPLAPQEGAEFTSQLAQFSSLEQLTNLNGGMDALVNNFNNSEKLSSLSTIGKEVACKSDSVLYSGDPVHLGYTLDGPAEAVTVQLLHDNELIATLDGTGLSKGNHYLDWDGKTNTGEAAPEGEYKIMVTTKLAENSETTASPLVKAKVTGIDFNSARQTTLLTSAGEIAYSSILGVFEPGETIQDTTADPAENNEKTTDHSTETDENTRETA